MQILGFIENMSYFKCLNCGEWSYIFGYGGVCVIVEEMDMNFFGEVDL